MPSFEQMPTPDKKMEKPRSFVEDVEGELITENSRLQGGTMERFAKSPMFKKVAKACLALSAFGAFSLAKAEFAEAGDHNRGRMEQSSGHGGHYGDQGGMYSSGNLHVDQRMYSSGSGYYGGGYDNYGGGGGYRGGGHGHEGGNLKGALKGAERDVVRGAGAGIAEGAYRGLANKVERFFGGGLNAQEQSRLENAKISAQEQYMHIGVWKDSSAYNMFLSDLNRAQSEQEIQFAKQKFNTAMNGGK